MFKDTFTKTVGDDPRSFGIFQIALDLHAKPWYNGGVKTEFLTELGVILSLLKVSDSEDTQTVHVRLTGKDLDDLSSLLWSAKYTYETRQKEMQTRTEQAQDETEA